MYIQLSNSFGHRSAERILPYENCSYSTVTWQVRRLVWNMRHFVRKVRNWAIEVQVRILRQPILFVRRFSHAVITCTVRICFSWRHFFLLFLYDSNNIGGMYSPPLLRGPWGAVLKPSLASLAPNQVNRSLRSCNATKIWRVNSFSLLFTIILCNSVVGQQFLLGVSQ